MPGSGSGGRPEAVMARGEWPRQGKRQLDAARRYLSLICKFEVVCSLNVMQELVSFTIDFPSPLLLLWMNN